MGVDYRNIGEFLDEQASKYKNKTFIIDGMTDEEISYAEFNKNVNKTANILKNIGIKKGEKVSVFVKNSPEFMYIFFACIKAGAVINPMTLNLKSEEVEFIINDSEAKALLVNYHFFDDTIGSILGKTKGIKNIIGIGEGRLDKVIDYYGEMKNASDEFKDESVKLEDEAAMIFTSGTTGKPKGVIQTQKNILVDLDAMADRMKYTEDDVHMVILPLQHVAGLYINACCALYTGATLVIFERFSKSRFWKSVEKHRITLVDVVPTVLFMLLNPHEDISKYDLGSFKYVMCGSAPLPPDVQDKFEETFNFNIYEVYGLSETGCCSHMLAPDPSNRKKGSFGSPLKCNASIIVDEDDNEVEPGKIGEIVMKGENVMSGYHNRPEANKEAFKNGWFHSGDIGYMDSDGCFYIVDRKKDIIIRGGENISPSEIDNVLFEHPAVKEAATIGIPDEVYGEEVKSFVVFKEGKKATEEELTQFCKKHLADAKCPKSIVFLDEIPKGPSGKLLRKKLREL